MENKKGSWGLVDKSSVGEEARNKAKEEVNELRKMTKNWSCGAAMMAINEELQLAESVEKRIELLIFKSEILESSTYGTIAKVDRY